MASAPDITSMFRDGAVRMKSGRAQRAANSLQWRQRFQNSPIYEIELNDRRKMSFNQIDNGELKGIGTGAVVWPAAHVLVKYLEKRFGNGGLNSKRVIDIGSGTGCVGLAACALGASVVLSDQSSVRNLLESNIDIYRNSIGNDEADVVYREYEWGGPVDQLNPPFDVVLVSDCVLPKLYPIEPLILAVKAVMDESSTAIFSYEHRTYPSYDPRHEFRRLAAEHGLCVRTIPLGDHDAYYCSDDIELWEVTFVTCEEQDNTMGRLQMTSWGDTLPVVSAHCLVPQLAGQNLAKRTLTIKQLVRSNEENGSAGSIGAVLWASSVVTSRFLLHYPSLGAIRELIHQRNNDARPVEGDRAVAVDLGAGCGLTSAVLSLCGWDVIAVDRPNLAGVLRENLALLTGCDDGPSRVVEFDWSLKDKSQEPRIQELKLLSPDLVVLSDCFYQTDSVLPILRVLNVICNDSTLVLITNEIRTALDEFMRAARKPQCQSSVGDDSLTFTWEFRELSLSDEDLEIFSGPQGYLAKRPLRQFLSFRTTS